MPGASASWRHEKCSAARIPPCAGGVLEDPSQAPDSQKLPRRVLYYDRPKICTKGSNARYPGDAYREEELISWQPQPDKYLLAVCRFGEISNQVVCMTRYFAAAVVLNRTLVIPPHSFTPTAGTRYNWTWDLALDIAAARRCVGGGPDTVISLAELRARISPPPGMAPVAVDAIVCFRSGSFFCNPPKWRIDGLGLKLPAGTPPALGKEYFTPDQFRAALGFVASARVLALEDFYGPRILFPGQHPYAPIRSTCGPEGYIQAHPVIRAAAAGIVSDLLGGDFVAMHLRRGDFYGLYKWPDIPRVARVLAKAAAVRGTSRIFVATNAHLLEMQFLTKVLNATKAGPRLELAFLPHIAELPTAVAARPWARAWMDLGFDKNRFAAATLEKHVCSQAALFIGSAWSTFSDDVYRIRRADRRINCEDKNFNEYM